MENVSYTNAIGTIMYVMISTRPNLAYAISSLSRFMSNPGKPHWEALKYLLRYINGSVNVGLSYKKRYNTLDLVRNVHSDFTGKKRHSKVHYYSVFHLGWKLH